MAGQYSLIFVANLQNLIPFLQVVKCGSFTAAAEQLGVTPPAISKSITRLEKELGVRLLQRTTRQIRLTTEGREFYEKINALHIGIDDAVETLKNSVVRPQGLVRMHVAATFGRYCLVPMLTKFFDIFPEIQLDITFDDETMVDLLEAGFDMGINYNTVNETDLISRYLCAVPIFLLASPTYLARHGIPSRPEDLLQHNCVNLRKEDGTMQQWRLRHIALLNKQHREPDVSEYVYNFADNVTEESDYLLTPTGNLVVSGHFDMFVHGALAGIGIAPFSIPMALPFLRSGQLKVVLPDYRVLVNGSQALQVMLHYPHRKRLTPKIQVLIDFLLENARQFDELPRDFNTYCV